jgi:NAD(P)-dependent dehydrogenase (short-subunit alcohol dehydrogenase family)
MLTEMSKRLAAGNPEVFANLCSHIMLNRMGEPDELNGAVVYLLSDASSFVTGEDILIDGGQGHL